MNFYHIPHHSQGRGLLHPHACGGCPRPRSALRRVKYLPAVLGAEYKIPGRGDAEARCIGFAPCTRGVKPMEAAITSASGTMLSKGRAWVGRKLPPGRPNPPRGAARQWSAFCRKLGSGHPLPSFQRASGRAGNCDAHQNGISPPPENSIVPSNPSPVSMAFFSPA